MRQTKILKGTELKPNWYLIDASVAPLGRIASQAASLLRGKHKIDFTPNLDCGDCVVIINASKAKFTGSKLDTKIYYDHSRHPGGLKERKLRLVMQENPVEVVERTVKGMLPHTKLGNKQRRKLFVYENEQHLQTAQNPVKYEVKV